MSKTLPFDIKYRPQIESGEYEVQTRDGKPVRIICWDKKKSSYPILGLIDTLTTEDLDSYTEEGLYCKNSQSNRDLVLIPVEQESDDEKIRGGLVTLVNVTANEVLLRVAGAGRDVLLDWLEKQKEPTKEELYAEAGTTEKEYVANTMEMVRAMCEKQKKLDKCPEYCVRSHCIGCSIYEKQKAQKPDIEICPHSTKSKSYKEKGYPIENCDYGLEIAFDILEKTFGEVRGYQTDDGIREHQTAIEAVRKAKEQKEQKSRWTEDDKKWLSEVYFAIDHSMYSEDERQAMKKYIDHLRSQSNSVEWNEEDEKMRDRIIDILNRTFSVYSALGTSSTKPSCPTYKDEIDWLKSLPERLGRPSENATTSKLTEFEKAVQEGTFLEILPSDIEAVKAHATKLLDLAKKELLESGELITSEHHKSLMDNLYKKLKGSIDEVLKDLPKWRKAPQGTNLKEDCIVVYPDGDPRLARAAVYDCKYIPFSLIKNLPTED